MSSDLGRTMPIERPDPLALLEQQEAQRLPWLLPLRHSRMAENPFAFFRGAAVVMGFLEEARIARMRGIKVAQKGGSVKSAFGQIRDFFAGNF